jgi:DNA-binding Lrp family transcriptional regulator
MRGLDDTDREILHLLMEDARRPYSEIADAVDLSAPAVSDRVDRLRDIGLIRRFTLDIDRSLLADGVSVLVTVEATPGAGERVHEALAGVDTVEDSFLTVDDRVVFTTTADNGDVGTVLDSTVDTADIREYDVRVLTDSDWSSHLDGAELAPSCAECGNTVTTEGESVSLDGDVYHFCCENCRENFVTRYRELQDGR